MSARIERGSIFHSSMVAEGPPPTSGPKVRVPELSRADQVEAYRAAANDDRAGAVGRWLEDSIHQAVAGLPEGGKVELEASLKGAAELYGSAKAKFGVERKDGAYLVTIQGAGGVGVGALAPGLEASLAGVLEGTATYRFGSDKELADALSAMVQVAPEAAGVVGGPMGLMAAGLARVVRDEDAVPRLIHAGEKLASVQLSAKVVAEAKLSTPIDQVKLEVGVEQAVTPLECKLDLAKGELVLSQSVEAGVKAGASQALSPAKLKASMAVAELRGKVILEERFPLPPGGLEKVLRDGPSVLREIAGKGRVEAKLRLEGSVAGLEVKAERKGSPEELLKALASGEDLIRGDDWSFQGFKVSAGISASIDGGPVKLGLGAKTKLPMLDQQGELTSLIQAASERLEESEAQERALLAAQALAR